MASCNFKNKLVIHFLNDFLHLLVGLKGCQWIISEIPSFSKWRNGGKILGQHSFYSDLQPPSLGFPAFWPPCCEREGWGRDGSTQGGSSSMRSRLPSHAFLDQSQPHTAARLLRERSQVSVYWWSPVKGNRECLPLFCDWLLQSSCLKRSQMSESPISAPMELVLFLIKEADI